jgi:prefoldin beta subunit
MAAEARQRELQTRMQSVAVELQKIESELQNCVEARQRLDSQLTENEQVKKEFAVLKQDDTVYKLVGPVLLKQDQVEAKGNVDKRIDYIKKEM